MGSWEVSYITYEWGELTMDTFANLLVGTKNIVLRSLIIRLCSGQRENSVDGIG